MGQVDFDDLSEDVQHTLADLSVKVDELQFEANIYRWLSLITLFLFIERVWPTLRSWL